MMRRKTLSSLVRFLVHKFNNIRLKNKLLICYGGLIVFSIFLVGFFSNYNMQKYIYEQAGDSFNQTLVQIKLNIEYKLNSYDELIKQTVFNSSFILALTKEYTLSADYTNEYLNTIGPVIKLNARDINIIDVFIYRNNRTLPLDAGGLVELDDAKSTWWFEKYYKGIEKFSTNDFIKISNSRIWIFTDEDLRPENYKTSNMKPKKRIAVIKPIIYDYEKLVGILELDIKYDTVFGEFKSKYDSGEDHFFILNDKHEVIFDSFEQPNLKNPIKDEYLQLIEGKEEGRFLITDNKNKDGNKLLLFSKGQYSGWMYLREISMKRLLSSAKTVREITVIIAVVCIFVSFIIGIAIASILSKRIAVLSGKMEQVEDLALDVNVKIDGRDEIGNLAKNFNRMIQKIRQLVAELKMSQQLKNEAEIKALQAQINPHFLYNALATINWMAMDNDNEKIISMVENLSTFYRLSLNKGSEYLMIGEEINQAKAYADIQKIRLGDKINIFCNVDEDIIEYYTMKLILQPFIENAVLHGAEYKDNSALNIVVRGYKSEDKIVLEVIDDGMGMRKAPEPFECAASGGYGIRNVHEKIQLQYGGGYGVKMFSNIGIGTKVSILIPIIMENPDINRLC